MATMCPKCDYERQPADSAPDYECPQCGVIYAKAQAAIHREALKSSTNGNGKAGSSSDGPDISQSEIAVLKTKLRQEQVNQERLRERKLAEEQNIINAAVESAPSSPSSYTITPPFLAKVFNVLAFLACLAALYCASNFGQTNRR